MRKNPSLKDLPLKKEYVAMWKKALENPNASFKHPFSWSRGIVTGKELADDFSKALQNRINSRGGLEFKGRKLDPDYQRQLWQASRQLNQPRLIIDWLPPDLKKRFGHRLRDTVGYR